MSKPVTRKSAFPAMSMCDGGMKSAHEAHLPLAFASSGWSTTRRMSAFRWVTEGTAHWWPAKAPLAMAVRPVMLSG